MSTKYPGGLITKSPVVPSGPTGTNTAPGIWTLEQAAYYQKLGQWPGLALDPYFNNVSMLLHGDGTNGAQNNTFLDSSTNNFTITRNGNPTQGTFTPFSQAAGYWANYFDGTGDYLSLASNAAFTVGTGDFTIEAWVYATDLGGGGGYQGIMSGRLQSGVYPGLCLVIDAFKFQLGVANVATSLTDTTNVITNQWNHVVGVRSGTNMALFVNGVRKASSTNSENGTSSAMAIGRYYPADDNYYFNGYISNARLVKGTAVYDPTQTTLTVPTAPLTAVTNTSLLTCQSNRFVDNSTNNFTLTANGNVAVQPFSPFRPTSAYSTAVNGGSGYFNGAGAYLSIADNAAFDFGSGDFTIEAWVYADALGTYNAVVAQWPVDGGSASNSFVLESVGSTMYFYWVQGTTLYGPATLGTISTGTWAHYAICRNGNTLYPFKNGVLGTTVSITQTLNNVTANVTVGGAVAGGGSWNGYISNLRMVKGTAVYTANFTPPTAPVTAITNTSLLTNYTNAGIFDNAMKNDLLTVGNAQISTAVVKYGTGSMAFDGATDYLLIRNTAVSTVFGTGSWTIEGWCYSTVINSSYKTLYANGYPVQIYQRNNTIEVYISSSPGSAVYIISALTGPASGITVNTWAHFALVKNGSTYTVYINGVAGTAATSATAIPFSSSVNAGIGDIVEFGSLPFSGYIDDFRITNGVARYTANFTPPTAAFPNQ